MALLSFNPKNLKPWANDETKLNADNMNALKDAIDNISDTLKSPNSETNGIVPTVNSMYQAVWGKETADNEQKTFGIYTYMQTLTPDVYGKHIKFDSTSPEEFITDENLRKYVNGTYQPLNTRVLDTDSNKVNSVVPSQFDIGGEIEDRYYGIAQAAFNTQLHSEYTRMRLYAHENQYKPTGIYFNDAGNTRFVAGVSGRSTWSTNSSINIDAATSIHLIASTLDLESRDNKIEIKAPQVVIGNLTITDNVIQGKDDTVATGIGSTEVPITSMYVKSLTVQDALQSKDVSATAIAVDSASIGGETVGTSAVELAIIGEARITSATINEAVVNQFTAESAQVKNITLSGNLSGGTIDSTVLNNVYLSGVIQPSGNSKVYFGVTEKPIAGMYVDSISITSGVLNGEQKTDNNSLVKYATLAQETQDRLDLEHRHDALIGNLDTAVQGLETADQTLQSQVNAIEAELDVIKNTPAVVDFKFEESQFDVVDKVVAIKSFDTAVEGAYPVKSNGVITWIKPDTTTVEGLSSSITTIEEKLVRIEGTLNEQQIAITVLQEQMASGGPTTIDDGSID